ncbi:MAG: hypothetical protein WD069_21245 [Planctomycetales bacterium]
MPEPIVVSWSGGKDSALALAALAAAPEWEVVGLLTTVTAGHDRISMHGVRRALLHAQAAAIGLPLIEVVIPPAASNGVYETAMGEAFDRLRDGLQLRSPLPRLCGGEGRGEGASGHPSEMSVGSFPGFQKCNKDGEPFASHSVRDSAATGSISPLTLTLSPAKPGERGPSVAGAETLDPPDIHSRGVAHVAFGDLYLADIRAYRERLVAKHGLAPVFPVWGRDTRELADEFIARGFVAHLVCIDPRALDESFAGRRFDFELLADLPAHVDPCGENGEFHTFVSDGPLFSRPVPVEPGKIVRRDSFVFRDLVLNTQIPNEVK